MNRYRPIARLIAAGVLVASCSGASVRKDASATELSESTTTTTIFRDTVPTTVAATTSTIVSAQTGVVISEIGFLGAWTGSRWLRWDDPRFDANVVVGQPLRLARIGQDPTVSRVIEATEGCTELQGPRGVSLPIAWPSDPNNLDAPSAIGVASSRVIVSRPITSLNNNNPTYTAIVQRYMATKSVVIDQLLRVDLDGDGTDEVIIVARDPRLDPGVTPLGGEYSVVLLRRIVNGAVTTIALQQNVDPVPTSTDAQYPSSTRNHVDAIADLNGDGAMEIIVSSRTYEGHSTSVYEPTSAVPSVSVLDNACGS